MSIMDGIKCTYTVQTDHKRKQLWCKDAVKMFNVEYNLC